MNKLFKILFFILILDFIWIYFFLYKHFVNMIKNIQNTNMIPRIFGIILAYIALIYIAYFFLPCTKNNIEAFMLGAMVYLVYDATNYATLNNWDVKIMIMDVLWGGTLFYILKHTL